jgi:hypothetical protein
MSPAAQHRRKSAVHFAKVIRPLRLPSLSSSKDGVGGLKEAKMTEARLHDDPISRIRQQMEVIRCAGHVSTCTADRIFMTRSDRPIPKEWIRRVDHDVYISKRWHDLEH